jgi:hypothetical protein
MRYRHDTDDVAIHAEDQPVWESLQWDSSVILIKLLAEGG